MRDDSESTTLKKTMKPFALCSLITLSLTALVLRTEAASAPDARPDVIKSPGPARHVASAQRVAAGTGARAHNGIVDATPVISEGNTLSPENAAIFHQTVADAAKSFSREMDFVNRWANSLQAEAKRETSLPSNQRTVISSIATITTKINSNTIKLAIGVHDVKKAIALCEEIRVDALHLKALELQLASLNSSNQNSNDTQKSDLLLRRAHIIIAKQEGPARYHLQHLADLAKRVITKLQAIDQTAQTLSTR